MCLSFTSREELSKGTGWTSSSSSEGSVNTSTSSSLLKLISESRLSESEEIWSPSDISESDLALVGLYQVCGFAPGVQVLALQNVSKS